MILPLLAAVLANPANNLVKCELGVSKLLEVRYVPIAASWVAQKPPSKMAKADIGIRCNAVQKALAKRVAICQSRVQYARI